MRQMLLIACIALSLTACGVKRDLIKPEDVKAHEDQRARELEQREQERKLDQQRNQMLQPIRP